MPKPIFWEKPSSPLLKPLLDELRASGVNPRLTFAFSNSGAREAIRVLQSDSPEPSAVKGLLGSKRVADVLVGLNALARLPQKEKNSAATITILRGLMTHEDAVVREQAVAELAKQPKMTIGVLRGLLKHPDWHVRKQAGIELTKRPEATIEELRDLFKHEDCALRRQAVIGLAKQSETPVDDMHDLLKHEDDKDVLKQAGIELANHVPVDKLRGLLKHRDFFVQLQAVVRLAKQPKTTVDDLRDLLEHRDWHVRLQAGIELTKRPEVTDKELRDLLENDYAIVRRQAGEKLAKRHAEGGGRRWLLGSQKPVFATPFSRELTVKFKQLNEIAAQLKQEFGGFVGVTVVGSSAKGYAIPASDLDYAVIASNRNVLTRFKKLAKDLHLCKEYYVNPALPENQRFLFHGLFFGDRKLLETRQADVINRISEVDWESIRGEIAEEELNLTEASRLGLSDDEPEKLALAVRLLRVPPELTEVKEIFRRRLNRVGARRA